MNPLIWECLTGPGQAWRVYARGDDMPHALRVAYERYQCSQVVVTAVVADGRVEYFYGALAFLYDLEEVLKSDAPAEVAGT
jgi:hypothetical protein